MPEMVSPRAIGSLVSFLLKLSEDIISERKTSSLLALGISIPTVFFPGITDTLVDTELEEDSIFYIKGSDSAGGDGIFMKTRDELGKEYQILKQEGYDVDEGEGDVIIQRAVTDLYTIDGESPISGTP